jgi:hypothetical protein
MRVSACQSMSGGDQRKKIAEEKAHQLMPH